MLGSADQPIWAVDAAGLIRFASPAALKALGYDDAQELLGRSSHDTIHCARADGASCVAGECPVLLPQVTGERVASELDWFIRRDGSTVPVSYVSVPVDTPSGRGATAIYDLNLEETGERAFGDALGDLVDVTREMAPDCEVTLDIDDGLAARSFGRRQGEVLRILGEALNNARRHAEAEHIVVRGTGTQTRLAVEVTDDGRGAAAWPAAPGQGVRGMYERAQLQGAELDIRTDDTGTTVRLQIALSPAARVSGAALPAGEHRSQSDNKELLLAARHAPGPARDRLVDASLPDIQQLARAVSTASPTQPRQLIEQGVAGLLRALDRYDPTLNTPFWAYASWWVRHAMR